MSYPPPSSSLQKIFYMTYYRTPMSSNGMRIFLCSLPEDLWACDSILSQRISRAQELGPSEWLNYLRNFFFEKEKSASGYTSDLYSGKVNDVDTRWLGLGLENHFDVLAAGGGLIED
jgi:hypothetical protein